MAAGETPSLTGEFTGETHGVLECTQTHPPQNQHQEGPICLQAVGEVTESRARAEQTALFPLWPLPHIQCHKQQSGLPHPGEYLRFYPLQSNTCAKTKKRGWNERTDENSRKRTKRHGDSQPIEEIANLSEAEFKALVIKILTELIELGFKIKEEIKATQSEIKQNIQGTNSEGKEMGTQINNLEQKEEISIQPEQNEETRIQKNEERLRNLQDNFNHSNIRIIRVPEGEEEEQEMEN